MKLTVRRTGALPLVAALFLGCAAPAPTPPPPAAQPTAPIAQPATATPVPATPVPAPTAAPEPTAAPTQATPSGTQELILATTTSTEDSGLLAILLPAFRSETGVTVNVIAVGTGQALKLGEDGNADVLLVHARAREDAFMEAGHGVRREDVMYNDFIIVGPPDDPAGAKGMTSAADALTTIAGAEATFVSRGDDSGTHSKETSVWKAAGIEPSGVWYVSAGQGMGDVLRMSDEQQAYTLSDRASYLALLKGGLDLQIVVEGDPVLFNPYGVIAVNSAKGAHIKADLANQLIDWLIAMPAQEIIAEFGVAEFGAPLFVPDSAIWRQEKGGQAGAGIPADAAIKVTGKVDQEMGWTEAQIQAMPMVQAETTNKAGEKQSFQGVPIKAMLAEAKVQDGAAVVVLVAADGYSAEVPMADLDACDNCIVAPQDGGGFRSVMPGMPGNMGVRDLVEIQVK